MANPIDAKTADQSPMAESLILHKLPIILEFFGELEYSIPSRDLILTSRSSLT